MIESCCTRILYDKVTNEPFLYKGIFENGHVITSLFSWELSIVGFTQLKLWYTSEKIMSDLEIGIIEDLGVLYRKEGLK